jgi:hypothetical protein
MVLEVENGWGTKGKQWNGSREWGGGSVSNNLINCCYWLAIK